MQKSLETPFNSEQKEILEYIFQGQTISQIAKKMHCSSSTISYQLGNLYAKYNVNSRYEFIVKVFGEIISSYKSILNNKSSKVVILESKIDVLLNILSCMVQNKNNPGIFDYWANEAKKYL